jgi:hypothetical protein
MPKFNVTFAADVRAYSREIEIEAANEEEAEARAAEVARKWPCSLPAYVAEDDREFTFNPEYETLDNIEVMTVYAAD